MSKPQTRSVHTTQSSPLTTLSGSEQDLNSSEDEDALIQQAASNPLPKDESESESDSEDDAPNMGSADIPQLAYRKDVDEWLKKFKVAMLQNKCRKDEDKAEYAALSFIDGSPAETWFEEQTETVRTSFASIEVAIKTTFRDTDTDAKHMVILEGLKLSDEDAIDEEKRESYVTKVRSTAKKVSDTYGSDAYKAKVIKSNIGPQTRAFMKIGKMTVAGVCEALMDLDDGDVELLSTRVKDNATKQDVKAIESNFAAEILKLSKQISNLKVANSKSRSKDASTETQVALPRA